MFGIRMLTLIYAGSTITLRQYSIVGDYFAYDSDASLPYRIATFPGRRSARIASAIARWGSLSWAGSAASNGAI